MKRRPGETKHQMIVRINRQRARSRASDHMNDGVIGVFLVSMGFVIGPPIAGIVVGGPLVALSLWGFVHGGYPERTPGRDRWARRVDADMDALSRGYLPPHSCHDPRIRQGLRNEGYREKVPDPTGESHD